MFEWGESIPRGGGEPNIILFYFLKQKLRALKQKRILFKKKKNSFSIVVFRILSSRVIV